MHIFEFILILTFLLLLGGAGAVYAYITLKKEQINGEKEDDAHNSESQKKLTHQVKQLQKRIESLEAIVVDNDVKLMTGLNSDNSLKSPTQLASDPENSEIHS